MATEVNLPKQIAKEFEPVPGEDFDKAWKRQVAFLESLEASGTPILYLPYADGKAVYVVVSMKPLRIAHVPIGDAWRLPTTFIRGLRASDIRKVKSPFTGQDEYVVAGGGLPMD